MAQIDLFIDTGAPNPSSALVSGVADTSSQSPPQLVQGDTPTLRIWLLQRTSTYPSQNPFTLLSTSGISIEAAIGDKFGDTSNYYTQQFTWTANPSTDPTQQFWTAQLPLNTAAITTAIGHAASYNSAFLEVKYLTAALTTTVLSVPVTIQAAVIKAGALTVPAGQTAISAEEVNANFLKRTVQGAITLVSADGTKRGVIYWDNDGTFHADPTN